MHEQNKSFVFLAVFAFMANGAIGAVSTALNFPAALAFAPKTAQRDISHDTRLLPRAQRECSFDASVLEHITRRENDIKISVDTAHTKTHDLLRDLVESQDVKLRELASLNHDLWLQVTNGSKRFEPGDMYKDDMHFGYDTIDGRRNIGLLLQGPPSGQSSPTGLKPSSRQVSGGEGVHTPLTLGERESANASHAPPGRVSTSSSVCTSGVYSSGAKFSSRARVKTPVKSGSALDKHSSAPAFVDQVLLALNPKPQFKKTRSMAADESHLRHILHIKDEKEKKEALDNFEASRSRGALALQLEEKVDAVMAVVILVNVAQIGLSSDIGRKWQGWLFVDGVFAVCYLAELVFKVYVNGCHEYLCGHERLWNHFDIIIVFLAVMELVWTFFAGDSFSNGPSISFFRMLRLCRLTRIVRLLRYPVFKELLMMVDGMVGGVRTLFWAIVLLLAPLYAIAIVLRETIGASEEHADIAAPFKTLSLSMFNIFRCVTGDCANERGEPIFVWLYNELGWFYAVFYCAVILLTNFGLFNVIIAIYVENTVVAAKSNEKLQRQRRLNNQEHLAVNCFRLIQALSTAQQNADQRVTVSTGGVTHAEESRRRFSVTEAVRVAIAPEVFKEALETLEVQCLLDNLDILPEDREDLFEILDADGNGELAVGEIIKGITKLRGDARRSDIVSASLTIKALSTRVDKMQEILQEENGMILAQTARWERIEKAVKLLVGTQQRSMSVSSPGGSETSTFSLMKL